MLELYGVLIPPLCSVTSLYAKTSHPFVLSQVYTLKRVCAEIFHTHSHTNLLIRRGNPDSGHDLDHKEGCGAICFNGIIGGL